MGKKVEIFHAVFAGQNIRALGKKKLSDLGLLLLDLLRKLQNLLRLAASSEGNPFESFKPVFYKKVVFIVLFPCVALIALRAEVRLDLFMDFLLVSVELGIRREVLSTGGTTEGFFAIANHPPLRKQGKNLEW